MYIQYILQKKIPNISEECMSNASVYNTYVNIKILSSI